MSEGTGKGVNPVGGMDIESAVGKLAGALDGGIWETEGTAEGIIDMLLGGVPDDDATRLRVELFGTARSLRA